MDVLLGSASISLGLRPRPLIPHLREGPRAVPRGDGGALEPSQDQRSIGSRRLHRRDTAPDSRLSGNAKLGVKVEKK